MAEWNESAELYIETCCVCKTVFGIAAQIHDVAMERTEAFVFCCPNGHEQCYQRVDLSAKNNVVDLRVVTP